MKSELRLEDHKVLAGEKVIEVWYKGNMVATVAGADGPGVRVISKFPLEAAPEVSASFINAFTVQVKQ